MTGDRMFLSDDATPAKRAEYDAALIRYRAETDEMIAMEDFQALGVCSCGACWKQIRQDEFRINLSGSVNVHVACYTEALPESVENYRRAILRAERNK